jgi:hypothetical protein
MSNQYVINHLEVRDGMREVLIKDAHASILKTIPWKKKEVEMILARMGLNLQSMCQLFISES